MRILYNSWKRAFKTPFGAVRQEESCRIEIRVPRRCAAMTVSLLLEPDGAPPSRISMAWIDLDEEGYDRYAATFSLPGCGLYFYYFEIEEENGNKKYGKSKEHRPNPIIQMDLFMDGDGFKRVSDDKSVDISKLPEDDKGLYYKDEPYTTKKLQQRLIITYSPKYALYQKSIRSKQIERAQAMLDSGNTKRTAGTQTIQPDLLEQQQLQKKVRLPISSIILMNIRSLKKASMMDFMQYARTC